MLSVKQFSSFDDIEQAWKTLEKQTVTSPFQTFQYQKLFSKHFAQAEQIFLLCVFEDALPVAIGGFEQLSDSVLLLGMKKVLGKEEITDFGDVLIATNYQSRAKDIWGVLLDFFSEKTKQLQLDYLQDESVSYEVLKEKGTGILEEVSPVISLPSSFDEYLLQLSRKNRHELRRKMKKMDETSSSFSLEKFSESLFETFVRLHRLSDTAKEKFMSEKMKQFFHDLARSSYGTWQVGFAHFIVEGKSAAMVMYFFNNTDILLYNSGFDPSYGHLSVGIVSKGLFIKESISKHYKVFDFLRGNERYKYELGAKDRKLFQVTIPF